MNQAPPSTAIEPQKDTDVNASAFVRIPGTENYALRDDIATTPECIRAGKLAWNYRIGSLPEVQALNAGDRVIDVGAFIGDTAAHFQERGARVLAFEPQADAAACFRINFRSFVENGHWCFVDHPAGDGRYVTLSDGKGGNMGARFCMPVTKPGEGDISTFRIDDIILPAKEPIRLIKIDAEGMEPCVLDGARGVIERDSPTVLVEVNLPMLAYQGGWRAEDILSRLPGYQVREYYRYDDRQWDWVCTRR